MKIITISLLLLFQGRWIRAETEIQRQDIKDLFQEYFGRINEEIRILKEKYESIRTNSELSLNKMVDMLVASKFQQQAQQDLKEDIKSITLDIKSMMETSDDKHQLYENKIEQILERLDNISMIRNETELSYESQGICNFDSSLKDVDFTTIEGKAGGTSFYNGYTPAHIFEATGWHSGEPTLPQAVWFQFGQPIKLVMYSFKSRLVNEVNMKPDGPSKYEFFASNGTDCSDQSFWVVLKRDNSGTPFSPKHSSRMELVPHPEFYTCYGYKVTEVPGRSNGDKWAKITNINWIMTYISDIQ